MTPIKTTITYTIPFQANPLVIGTTCHLFAAFLIAYTKKIKLRLAWENTLWTRVQSPPPPPFKLGQCSSCIQTVERLPAAYSLIRISLLYRVGWVIWFSVFMLNHRASYSLTAVGFIEGAMRKSWIKSHSVYKDDFKRCSFSQDWPQTLCTCAQASIFPFALCLLL